MNNPKILVLDEATSSVDTSTEQQIEKAMDALILNRTSIIVGLMPCNRPEGKPMAIVLDHGQVIESGTPQNYLN